MVPYGVATSLALSAALAIAKALGWVESTAVTVLAVVSVCLSFLLAIRTKLVKEFPESNHGRLAASAVSAFLLVLLVSFVARQRTQVLVAEGSAVDVEERSEDEILVVVQRSLRLEGVADADVAGEMARAIVDRGSDFGDVRVRVEIVDELSGLEDAALAAEYVREKDVSLLVWSRESAVRLTVNVTLGMTLGSDWAEDPEGTVHMDVAGVSSEYTEGQVTASTNYVDVVTDGVPADVSNAVAVLVAWVSSNPSTRWLLLDDAIEDGVEVFSTVGAVAHILRAVEVGEQTSEERQAHAVRATQLSDQTAIWQIRASIELATDRSDLALITYFESVRKPDHGAAYLHQAGLVFLGSGYPLEAVDAFSRAIALDDRDEFLHSRALAQIQLGLLIEAKGDLERLVSLPRRHSSVNQVAFANNQLALVHLQLADVDSALLISNSLMNQVFSGYQPGDIEMFASSGADLEDHVLAAEILYVRARIVRADSEDESLWLVREAISLLPGSRPGSTALAVVGTHELEFDTTDPYMVQKRADLEAFEWAITNEADTLSSAVENLVWLEDTGQLIGMPLDVLNALKRASECRTVSTSLRQAFLETPYPTVSLEPC